MPSAPKHFALDSSSSTSTSVLPHLPFATTLIAAPSPPPPPPSQSPSLRYPIQRAPLASSPSSTPPRPTSTSQGSASCPLTFPPSPSQEERDQGPSIMSSHHQGVAHAHGHAPGSGLSAGRGPQVVQGQGQGQGVHLSLPESVQMPGSPMMTNSFGTPSLDPGRSIGAFASVAGTAMAAVTAADAKDHDLDVDHDAVDDGEHGMDVDANDHDHVDGPNALRVLLAIDGLHGHGGDTDCLGLELEAGGGCRRGSGAANALGLGSVQSSSALSLPSSLIASTHALDPLHFDPALLCGLDDSLLLPSVRPHHPHVAAVLPAQHSLDLSQLQHCDQGAMSTSVMSTPSSTHPRSTPLGTPTPSPLLPAPIPPSTTTSGFAPASATAVDQLFADMLASASVPTHHQSSEQSAADQAFVDALLSTAADLYPPLQSTAVAVPDPDLFAFLSAVPEDELQAMLTAADAVLDDDDDDQGSDDNNNKPAMSRPISAFQSPMPQPEDRLLTDDGGEDEYDDTSSLPDSAYALPPANPHQDHDSDQEDDQDSDDNENDNDAYNVRYGQRVIQVRNLEEGEVSGLSPPMGVLNDFTNTSSSSDASDTDNDHLPVTPPRGGRARPYASTSSPTRSDDVISPHSDLFAAAPLPSAPGPNINALFERHVAPTLVTSDAESAACASPTAGTPATHRQALHYEQDNEHEFGSPAAMPVFDDTTTLGAPASTMHQLRFAPLTVWTTAPLPFPQHLQYDAPPTPLPTQHMRPPSAASTASTRTSTTTSALIDALPWGQAEVVDSPYRRRRPRKPSMRVYPRYQPPQHAQYEPSGLQVPMSPASPSSSYAHGYMSPPPPPPPAYHMASSGSASASSALPSPHGSNESAPGTTGARGMSPPPMASTAWAASAGYSAQQQQQQQMRSRNVEYSAMAQASSESRSRDRYGRSAGGW